MVMCGRCYNQDEGAEGSGPTASACSAVLSEAELGGYGIKKTMYGQKCTQSSKGGGSMSMRARKPGIIPGCTQKVRSISLSSFTWPKADYDD